VFYFSKGIPEFFNNPVNMNSNENIQDNIPSTNQLLSRQQLEMGTSVAERKLEEARFDSHQMVVNDQSSSEINLDNSKYFLELYYLISHTRVSGEATAMPGSHGNIQTITTSKNNFIFL
jgi:hypothetical protein